VITFRLTHSKERLSVQGAFQQQKAHQRRTFSAGLQ